MKRVAWTLLLALTLSLTAVSPAVADPVGVTVTVPGSVTSPTTPSDDGGSGDGGSDDGSGGGNLPKTGLPISSMVFVAIALIVVGAGAMWLGRRPGKTRSAGLPAFAKGQHL